MKMEIKVKTKIHPSEDVEKVIESVENIFPSIDFNIDDDFLKGKSEELKSLENFRNKLGLQAIRDSARRELKKGSSRNKIRFSLNKQAAMVDKISFSHGETPLGPIRVSIESEDPEELINYLAPSKKEKSS
ncbi:hypothetical protein AKJ49_01185 [candidate division MSBL1 archaeon SCGC-AAA382A03]|uniref:UPF0201 protein AKJ49_01185 n=1 Tax=candidate division MSBL1 archaeon SCGC-AAA382A03 TaxID=1698278 RepID=A0A133VFP9_9EURY|nr:hypothetical protein AKJ49_01185 [candidate division MSBL1 archaeon SCGC-AAA382A03]